MSHKQARPFWPELPCGRFEIDHVHSLLTEWAALAELKSVATPKDNPHVLFLNSVVHVVECALILWLAPYAHNRGVNSDLFQDNDYLTSAFEARLFQPGYPLEMAEALGICYLLERPWELSPDDSNGYADELIRRIKDIALYEVEPSAFWEQKAVDATQAGEQFKKVAEKFTKGRKPGTQSVIKKYVEGVVAGDLRKSNIHLWKTLVDAVSGAEDDEECPLYSDNNCLFEETTHKKYVPKRFNNHLADLRNPKK